MDAERLDVFDDDGGRPVPPEDGERPEVRAPLDPSTREQAGAAVRDVRALLAELRWDRSHGTLAFGDDLTATLEAALRAWDADAQADGADARRPTLATVDQMEDALSDVLDAIDASHHDLRQRVRRTRDGLHEAGNLLAHEAEPARDVLGQQRGLLDG